MYKRKQPGKCLQTGQFLPHLAEIVVSAGLVIGAAFQGNSVIKNYEYSSAYTDLRQIESTLWAYHDKHGYWLDQCPVNKDVESACDTETTRLMGAINSLNSDTKPGLHYSLAFADSSGGARKERVIAIKGFSAGFAQYLDEKIDGKVSMTQGRVRYLSPSQNQIGYYYESKLN